MNARASIPRSGGAGSGEHPFRATVWVALAALLPRLWHLAEFSRLPWFRALQMDAKYHAEWARRLVEGGWHDPQVFFRAPVYPYLLAVLQTVSGEILWTARLVQIALGVGTVILTHRIALRLLPGRWSTIAGLLAALTWVPIHYETELLLEPLVTFLVVLTLFLAVRIDRRPPVGLLLCWGGLVGLASATRPNALVLLPLLPMYAAFLDHGALPVASPARGRQEASGRRRHRRFSGSAPWLRALPRPAAMVLAGFLVPVLPIWLHNARYGDPATVLAWQGGINLYLGNNPSADGWSATAPEMRTDWRGSFDDAVRIAHEKSGGRRLRPSQISDYWTREAVRYWAADPGRAIRLTATKVLLFWGNAEIKNNEDPRFMRHTMASLRWLPVSFGILAPLALVGLALAVRAGPRWGLLAGFTLAWFASIVPFFVCARYRLPVTPLLPLLAMLALCRGAQWWRARRWRAVLPAAGAALLLAPLLWAPRARVESGGFFQAWNNLGDAYRELGNAADAAGAYRQALALNPRYLPSWNNLGVTLEALGRPEEAERAYREGLAIEPAHPTMRRNLGQVLEARGKLAEAAEVYRAILRDYPEGWDTALFLTGVLEAQGKREEAADVCRLSLRQDPRLSPVRARLVGLLRALGRPVEADSALWEGLRLAPGDPELRRLQARG